MDERECIYVNGEWVPSNGSTRIDVENPYTETTIGSIPACTESDVDRAVRAAQMALETWSGTVPSERANIIDRICGALESHQEQLAQLITAEMGAPIRATRMVQTGIPISVAKSIAELLRNFSFEESVRNSLIFKEPVGVVAAITPWNYPLHQVIAKVIPALAAGCTIVLKPSEVAPLVSFRLFDIFHEVGLPAGVVNLVSGTGPVVGEALACHPGVDMVSFTGSTQAGKRVGALALGTVKKMALELGGKSAHVILPDADLAKAVSSGITGCFFNSGQTCTAWTRMLVHRSDYEEASALAVERASQFTLGDPTDEGTRLGPLVSASQRTRVLEFISQGKREGAKLLCGGDIPVDRTQTGHFVQPTVFGNVESEMKIAQEEIFGPVLSILSYDDEEHAVQIANDSAYGLSGSVWSGDQQRAINVARRIRTGKVDINGGAYNPAAPFGGYKQSGLGRELGSWGIEEFCEVKSLQL